MALRPSLPTLRGVYRQFLLRYGNCSANVLGRLYDVPRHGYNHLSSVIWARGARRRTMKTLEELPQGVLALDPLPNELEPQYPPVIQQARINMNKFSNCVVLTRVGSFYELYFEHAEEIGPLLNIKVTQKKAGVWSVPMAGFPFYQLDRMLRILVLNHRRYVAISEEYANQMREKMGGLMFDRKITRIITPGTLIDEKFLDGNENNFLLALSAPSVTLDKLEDAPEALAQPVGLAWLDLSTGDFFTQESSVAALGGDISRIAPQEIVLDQAIRGEEGNFIVKKLEDEKLFITYHPQPPSSADPISTWEDMLESPVSQHMKSRFSELEIQAGSNLLHYVKAQLPGLHMKLQPPIKRFAEEMMAIDSNSMRGLEIKKTLRDGVAKGSLLHTVDRTVTKSGARLLAQWLTSPVTSLEVINRRLDLVEFFRINETLREDVVALLRRTEDSQRLAQKFAMGRGTADDLISLARTIEVTQHLFNRLSQEVVEDNADSLGALVERLNIPTDLGRMITESIDEEGLILQQKIQESETAELAAMAEAAIGEIEDPDEITKASSTKKLRLSKETDTSGYFEGKNGLSRVEPWVMLRTASPILLRLHKRLDKQFENKKELTEQLREELVAPSLVLKWTPGQGHFCHVKGKDAKATSEKISDAHAIGATKHTRAFQHIEWTELGAKIDQTRLQIRAEEQTVFRRLRDEVIRHLSVLRCNAAVLDEVDIATSFAQLAHEKDLVRPILNEGTSHKIIGGRHPMVEDGLGEQGRKFTPNDCLVGEAERLWLITGPNMAGKSTFLRQNALISILAQVGCFVPADYAEIGIVDRVFSRVGSADNLFRDQSTFMVEMLEAADILHKATPRSFVIIDEIGRGTAPTEGTAIAFACLDHLYRINKSRTLFATHFHEMVDWTRNYDKIGYYCTDLQEGSDGAFTYIHELRKGINRQSHALKVAKLAGIPDEAIRMAEKVITSMEESSAPSISAFQSGY